MNYHDRINKLEFLDEIEELVLILKHYAVSWGTKGDKLNNMKIKKF